MTYTGRSEPGTKGLEEGEAGHRFPSLDRKGTPPPLRTPRIVSWVARCLVYPFMMLDLLMQWLVKSLRPPPYEILGGCHQCGQCCDYILVGWPGIMDRMRLLGRFWMWWNTQVLGFYYRGFEIEDGEDGVARVMSCRNIREDGRCGRYLLRPAICRQWPVRDRCRLPHVFPGCGYRIELTPEGERMAEEYRQTVARDRERRGGD